MNKQDMLKIQKCVLRVNIHCEGCMHKVKKRLQKVDGVYEVSIDSQQGKVTVTGNVDPATLIQKLEKAGKHAELWEAPQRPPMPIFVSGDQLKKFQMESGKKGGNHEQQQQKNGNAFVQIRQGKGFKDDKEPKSVRFSLPEEEFDDEDEFSDEEFDDEFDDEFDAPKKSVKAVSAAVDGHKSSKVASDAHHKGDKDGKAKKGGGGGGGGFDMFFFKGMLKKGGRKKGDSDKKSKKGEHKKEDGGNKGGFELGDFKKGKNEDGLSKKGGEGFDGGKQQQHGFSEMKANHKGGGGGGGGGGSGRNMDMMGQKRGFPPVAMNGGGFAGAVPGNNPYSQQQQYMAHMMMNQHGYGAYHPAPYARSPPPGMVYGPPPPGMIYGPPPPMSYGPPPAATEQYTHMFSDENTDSCSIM